MKKEPVSATVKSYDGTQLYCLKDVVSNPHAVVLIVHGLAEHLGRYNYVADRLNSFGYTVYRYDNRGHGKSEGPRCYLDDANELFDDVNVMVDLVKRENSGLGGKS